MEVNQLLHDIGELATRFAEVTDTTHPCLREFSATSVVDMPTGPITFVVRQTIQKSNHAEGPKISISIMLAPQVQANASTQTLPTSVPAKVTPKAVPPKVSVATRPEHDPNSLETLTKAIDQQTKKRTLEDILEKKDATSNTSPSKKQKEPEEIIEVEDEIKIPTPRASPEPVAPSKAKFAPPPVNLRKKQTA